ncbi:hypothetical protein AAD001_00735 [Colwelliaceae bacterium 6471]
MKIWRTYSDKFLAISQREQMLILATGLVIVVFGLFNFVIDGQMTEMSAQKKQISQLSSTNHSMKNSLNELQRTLAQDPNTALKQQIAQYEQKLAKVDAELLTLTSDLIDPVQMRHALIELLKVQKGVSLVSFQLVGAQPIAIQQLSTEKNSSAVDEKQLKNEQQQPSLGLYRHGIKLKLTGNYFQLRDYLTQLEGLSWKFFWQEFNYQMTEYPLSELEIEMYSLSTKREFIGV